MNKMGFGFLRLPRLNPDDEKSVDYALTSRLADAFMAAGGSYFDTAYTYLGGLSEVALRECVVRRYPREAFHIADKLPVWKVKRREDMRRMFDEQKQRCGVDYFDVYLLHALNAENYETSQRFDQFAFLRELKQSGEAGKIGFSYHDGPELLDEILTAHPEVDYVQLQINYLDWNSPSLQARRLYETAVRHGRRVIVMEPVKGGSLAGPTDEAAALLHALDANESPAAWAVRFAQSLPGVEVVLSGMNAMEQVQDNLRDLPPLTSLEEETLLRAAEVLRAAIAVPCTACEYCVPGCPKQIPIPRYFALYNEYAREPREVWKMQHVYDALAQRLGRAGECIGCGACEASCPQHIEITQWMPRVAQAFGEELERAVNRVRNSPGKR